MTAAAALHIDAGTLAAIVLALLGLIGAGVLSVRRGRSQAQEQATETYKEAAEAWESRYRAQQEEIAAQARRIDTLNQKVDAGEQERDRLRAQIQDLQSRPLEFDSLVSSVRDLATAVQAAVANEERIREHAHNLGALGGALNLKLDAVLRQMGIDIPASPPSAMTEGAP